MHAHSEDQEPFDGDESSNGNSDDLQDSSMPVEAHTGDEHVAGQPSSRGFSRLSSVRRYFTTHGFRFLAGLLCFTLCAIILLLPSPYVIEMPGPTRNVLGNDPAPVIQLTGVAADTTSASTTQDKASSDTNGHEHGYADSGKLLMLTVNASGVPGSPVTTAETLVAWLNPHENVMPSEAVFPIGQSAEEYTKQSQGEMTGSQDTAATVAVAYATRLGVDASHVKVTMHIDDIGGPSAGMMYTLGVVDKLTARNETGGKTIAGTGTIDKDGNVGAIGGIRLKMLGAKRDGATWFLAPQSNCDEVVGHVPQGLRDVRVSTFDEAYRALVAIGQGKGSSLPHCTASSGAKG